MLFYYGNSPTLLGAAHSQLQLEKTRMYEKKPKRMRRVLSIIRQTEIEVGRNNEKRVVAAYTTNYPFPDRISWIKTVRLSTESEDQRGIDVVFETDVGEIHLQLKSSKWMESEFLKNQRNQRYDRKIVTAIVSPSLDSTDICKVVTPVIAAERRRRMLEK